MRARAACRGHGHDLFFSDEALDVLAAKAICAACPVQAECLQKALDNDEHGIWGGLTEVERRLYRRLYGLTVGDKIQELNLSSFLPPRGVPETCAS